jgi:hypothetical protein
LKKARASKSEDELAKVKKTISEAKAAYESEKKALLAPV